MGLYMSAYAGAYLVLSNITEEVQETHPYTLKFCSIDKDHGKQTGDFCPKCGAPVWSKEMSNTQKKTIKRQCQWQKFGDDFMNVASFMGNAKNFVLIPQVGRGSWEISLPQNFTERGGGGYLNASKFENADEKKAIFLRRFQDYINTLTDAGFEVEVQVGLLIWWM